MPAKDPAQYMAEYRAKQKQAKEQAPLPKQKDQSEAELKSSPVTKPRRTLPETTEREFQSKESKFQYLPGDHWVASLTQQERDRILDKVNTHKRVPR